MDEFFDSGLGLLTMSSAGVLALTASKLLLGTATGLGPNGGSTRYRSHRASATRLAPRHRPNPHHLDWLYRPKSTAQSSESNDCCATNFDYRNHGFVCISWSFEGVMADRHERGPQLGGVCALPNSGEVAQMP